MSGTLVKIQFKFPNWAEAFKRRQQEIWQIMAAAAQTNRALLFQSEGSYNGHAQWKPLRFRNGQPLMDKGALKNSMGPTTLSGRPVQREGGILRYAGSATQPIVTIGTTLKYARLMNDGTAAMPGGVMRAKNGSALKIPVPAGMAANDQNKRLIAEAKVSSSASRRRKYLGNIERKIKKSRNKDIFKLAHKARQAEQSRGAFIFRKSVRIPARPFDQWNSRDQAEMEATLVGKLAQILREEKPA